MENVNDDVPQLIAIANRLAAHLCDDGTCIRHLDRSVALIRYQFVDRLVLKCSAQGMYVMNLAGNFEI